MKMTTELRNKLKGITHFFFDVDGVLTNGSVTIFENNVPIRTLSSKDGYALQLAGKKGYPVVIITGGSSEDVKTALLNLGADKVYLKAHNKLELFEDYCLMNKVDPSTCMYMGDDIPDYEVMSRVSLAACPKNAAPEIIGISDFVSTKNGGDGCAREIVELIMKERNDWFIPNQSKLKDYTW